MKTAKIKIESYKDSDGWSNLINDLGLDEESTYDIFEHGEFATFTIEVDENLNIVGGKIHKNKQD